MTKRRAPPRGAVVSFVHEHSLSLVLVVIVLGLIALYAGSDETTHRGTFFGNAIADWLGVLVFVVATKYFAETGSGESRPPSPRVHQRVGRFLLVHSLTIVLAITGTAGAVLYARSKVDSKVGEVVGNIVSDWFQVLGLVVLTKYAVWSELV